MAALRSTMFRLVVASTVVATMSAAGAVAVESPARAGPAGATAEAAPGERTSRFVPVGPLRLADSRQADCGCARIDGNTIRVVVTGRDGVPSPITAVAVTITAIGGPLTGFVAAYSAGQPRPPTSVVNVRAGAVAANSALLAVGSDGAIDLFTQVDMELVVDLTGVFTASAEASAGRFRPMGPDRLMDTREISAAGIEPGGSVTVPLPDNISSRATAVAVNVTSVGELGPGFVTGGAAGASPPPTSFVNPDGSGRPRAASVILPVSPQGLTLRTTAGGHLLVDIVGWFTGESEPTVTDGLFVAVTPVRLVDTRVTAPRIWPIGEREIESPVTGAGALVTNVTLDQADGPGFVSAYPAGAPLPPTSSLNAPALDATVSNLAITTVSDRGTAYFSSSGTDLVVDLTGYFTGTPVAAVLPPRPNVMPVQRVLMIGDSTLGALEVVTGTQRALTGFPYVLDTKNCRRLVTQGCTSDYTKIAPTTVVEAITAAPGTFATVVIKAGYNDPLTPFVPAVDAIVAAARAKGARTILWFTFSDSTSAYVQLLERDNEILRELAGSAAYPDLVMADWRNFAAPATGWYIADRRHLTSLGAWGTADYIARWIAHLDRRPCPTPWSVGAALESTCPNPDIYASATGTVPDLKALYGF